MGFTRSHMAQPFVPILQSLDALQLTATKHGLSGNQQHLSCAAGLLDPGERTGLNGGAGVDTFDGGEGTALPLSQINGVRLLQEAIIPRGLVPPAGYKAAARYEPVFDRGGNLAVIAVKPDVTPEALEKTMRQALVDLGSPGRSIGSDGVFRILARTVVHPRPGVSRLLTVATLERNSRNEKGEPAAFVSGDLKVDSVRRLVLVGGEEVKLSPREFEILALLVRHAGKVLTHQFIMREIWKVTTDVQYLRIYIKQLRRKIEADPGQPRHIVTETGVGYRLRALD